MATSPSCRLLSLSNTRHHRALACTRPSRAGGGAPLGNAPVLPVLLLPQKGSWLPDTDKGLQNVSTEHEPVAFQPGYKPVPSFTALCFVDSEVV